MDSRENDPVAELGWKDGTVAEFLGLTPEESALIEMKLALNSDHKNKGHLENDEASPPHPFGSYDTSHLIDLYPIANADLETEHSTLIAACFAQHNYISMYVESKDVFLKSFEICVYYKDIADLINFLSVISSYQEVISTENYLEFIARLLDLNLKVVWLSGQALLEEVTYQNLSEGHPDLQMI